MTKQNVCSACLNCIHDNEYIEALNKEWHSDCFRYFEQKLICTVKAVHFEFQFIKPLYHLKYLILNPYSKYRCSVCDETLSDWYFEKGDILFCQMHYWAKYGQSCQQCSQVIFICGLKSSLLICHFVVQLITGGPVMVAGDHKFHPECFQCSSCRCFIGDGDSYALVERSKLYWYDKQTDLT